MVYLVSPFFAPLLKPESKLIYPAWLLPELPEVLPSANVPRGCPKNEHKNLVQETMTRIAYSTTIA